MPNPLDFKITDPDAMRYELMRSAGYAGGGIVKDEDLKPQTKPTIADIIAEIGANRKELDRIVGGGKYYPGRMNQTQLEAIRLLQSANQSENPDRWLETLQPYGKANIEFNLNNNREAGFVDKYAPNRAVIQNMQDAANTVPHELTHTLQLNSGATLPDIINRAQSLPTEMRDNIFPSQNRFDDPLEAWANVNARAHNVAAQGGDFINSPEGQALFPTPQAQREYYANAMPGVNSLTPDTGTFVPNNESYISQARRALGFADGGAVKMADGGISLSDLDDHDSPFSVYNKTSYGSEVPSGVSDIDQQRYELSMRGQQDAENRARTHRDNLNAIDPSGVLGVADALGTVGKSIAALPVHAARQAYHWLSGGTPETAPTGHDYEAWMMPKTQEGAELLETLGEIPAKITGSEMGFGMHPNLWAMKQPSIAQMRAGLKLGAERVAPTLGRIDQAVRSGYESGLIPQPGMSIKDVSEKDIRTAGRIAHQEQAAMRAARDAEVAEQLENLPPRNKKANEELGLYHPVGGGIKLSKPVYGMHATTVADPSFNPPDIGIITPEQLVKEQAALIPLVGDRAAAGRYLTHVGENELEEVVRLTGGPRYMDANYNHINPEESAGWESGAARVTSLSNQAQRAGEGVRPVYGIYTAGSGTNTDFNVMGANALIQQIPFGKITKKAEKEFDLAMLTATKDSPAIPNWPGIRSPDARKMLLDKSNGIMRTKLFNTMGKENFQSMGFPDVPATRKAIIEPELLDVPTNQAGFRLARMDTTGRIIENPNIPSDYPVSMAAKVAGQLDVPADYKDVFQSHFDARRLLGQPESGDYYSFSRAHPIQYADEEWLNRLMEKRLAIERKIKQGKYAKGGKVQFANDPDAMKNELKARKAMGGITAPQNEMRTPAGGTMKNLTWEDYRHAIGMREGSNSAVKSKASKKPSVVSTAEEPYNLDEMRHALVRRKG